MKSRMTLVVVSALGMVLGVATAGRAATVYTWQSSGDTDWNTSGNWDVGGVPVDEYAGQTGLNGDMTIIFNGTVMPTANVPGMAGVNGPQTYNTPILDLRSGGALTVDYVGGNDGLWINRSAPETLLIVGDGIGGPNDVTLNVTGGLQLIRHTGGGPFTTVVNSDGKLVVQNELQLAYHPNRFAVLDVNGGTVDVGGNLRGVLYTAIDTRQSRIEIADKGSVTVGGVVSNFVRSGGGPSYAVVDFRDPSGTLTADFGGDFANIAAVNAAVGSTFISSSGGKPLAVDNGNGTFTVGGLAPFTGNTGPGGFQSTATASNLALWLDASDASTFTFVTGNQVDTWRDKSANGNTATGSGGTIARTTGANGTAKVDLDGSNYFALASDVTLPTTGSGSSAFVVAKTTDAVGNDTVMSQQGQNVQFFRQANASVHFYKGPPDRSFSDSGLTTDRVRYADFNDPSGTVRYFADGTFLNANTQNSSSWVLNRLGGGGGCCANWVGDIAEIVLYNRQLNTAEQQIIENSLAAKYGLGTANEHYTGDDPGKGNYDLDVVGIGRADASNYVWGAGSQGFGMASDLLDNGEWVLAGHKSTTNGWVTDDLPPEAQGRWERVWYLDVTGQPDVTLAFDHSDGGLAAPPAGQPLGLLFSASDPFHFSFVALNPTVSGDLVMFDLTGQTLQSGYYTLGIVPEPSTFIMAAFGLLGLGLCGCRRRKPTR